MEVVFDKSYKLAMLTRLCSSLKNSSSSCLVKGLTKDLVTFDMGLCGFFTLVLTGDIKLKVSGAVVVF